LQALPDAEGFIEGAARTTTGDSVTRHTTLTQTAEPKAAVVGSADARLTTAIRKSPCVLIEITATRQFCIKVHLDNQAGTTLKRGRPPAGRLPFGAGLHGLP
jgi:hypothetical protein